MSWRCYLGDTVTGLVAQPIDVPNFSWTVTVSDSSLSTSRDKGTGEMDATGLTVPWGAVPADDPAERASMLSSYRRCLTVFWYDEQDVLDGSLGTPILWGAVGVRTDTRLDTSFDLVSPMGLLGSRYAVAEGAYGTGAGGTSPGSVRYDGYSYRGIASEVGRLCTSYKPGGQLPIDWTYLGEKGTRAREYKAFDVQNLSCADIFGKLANVIGGPDMQFRPYMADPSHVRLRFLAGSDADVYLGQDTVHALTSFPGGGTIHNLKVDHASAVHRVYASGAGTDAAQITALAEDLSLVTMRDPYPLVETAYSDSDTDSLDVLKGHAQSQLQGNALPIMQVTGEVDFDDPGVPAPGSIWPGEMVDLAVDGFPTLPDGVYRMRLMSMSGDQSSVATLKFDVDFDPIY